MRRICWILCVFLLAANLSGALCAEAVSVSAEAAVLLCAQTGEVLYEKNAHARLPMASTTKIMTALLALESASPQRVITTTAQMVTVEGTSMGLLPGDQVSLYALCCGMLLSSGNDAANTAAIALAGSTQAFALMMNARAQQIGMQDTHFVTPSGLDDAEHYSTAFDMALLGIAALRNPQFAQICQSKRITVSYGNPPYSRTLTNHNRLLDAVDGCIGVKTGFTKKSGRCLVSAARRDGVTLVAVTLRDPDDWRDHEVLFEYGFSRLRRMIVEEGPDGVSVPVTGGMRAQAALTFASPPETVTDGSLPTLERRLLLPHFLYAPVHAGDWVGTAAYYANGECICTAELVAAENVEIQPAPPQPQKSRFRTWLESLKKVL